MEKKKATWLERFRKELDFYKRVYKDKRTPKLSRFFLGAAIAYALSPVDLIPDFIPVIGFLDDLIIVPALIWIAVQMIPGEVMKEQRSRRKTVDSRRKTEDGGQ